MIEYRYYFDEDSLKTKLQVERLRVFRSVLLSLIIIFFIRIIVQAFWPSISSNYCYFLLILPTIIILFNLKFITKSKYSNETNEWQRGYIEDDGTFYFEGLTETLIIPFAEVACFHAAENLIIIQGTHETRSLRFYFFKKGFATNEQFLAIKNILQNGIAGHKGLGKNVDYFHNIKKYLAGF
ncbi:hypothetical protein AAEX28_13945 [Lentisphaerota bacterium WC36G]|nr:hypothetical protein LJT99_00695 [Lentisphaerae bacterium WC36]